MRAVAAAWLARHRFERGQGARRSGPAPAASGRCPVGCPRRRPPAPARAQSPAPDRTTVRPRACGRHCGGRRPEHAKPQHLERFVADLAEHRQCALHAAHAVVGAGAVFDEDRRSVDLRPRGLRARRPTTRSTSHSARSRPGSAGGDPGPLRPRRGSSTRRPRATGSRWREPRPAPASRNRRPRPPAPRQPARRPRIGARALR